MIQATISELGRALGVSHAAIQKAIKTGRIPPALVGSKERPSGRTVPVILDFEAARAAFIGYASPARGAKGALPASDDADETIPAIAKSRAITEAYKAKTARLEYEERAARLVDADEFRIKLTAQIVAARTRLLGVPSRAKGRIPHLTVAELAILDGLIRETLEDIAGSVHDRMRSFLDSIQAQWRAAVDYTPTLLTEEKKS